MAPSYEVGDLILVRTVDPADLQIGDVIIYEIDYGYIQERILHQVWNITIIDEERYFALYGEMNSRPDVHKTARDVIHVPTYDVNGRRIIISLVPDKTIQGQVIYRIPYLGWPIAILISFYGFFSLIFVATLLYWMLYGRITFSKIKGLGSLAVAGIIIIILLQVFSWSDGRVVESIELSKNEFGGSIEPGESAEYIVLGETKQIWGPTYPTNGTIGVQVLTKYPQNMTILLNKNVRQWNGTTIEDLNYTEVLVIDQIGLVIASNRVSSEYLGFYFPFITSVQDSYITVDAFAYSTRLTPDGIIGEETLQFVQDMQKWDFYVRYKFAEPGFLIKYEYHVVVHPYVRPHLLFIAIAFVFIGLGYWKVDRTPFFWKKNEILEE